ncbi:outer membrane beta-barrel protein [Hyalangium versicolor]|uniref:outer membrane beta-barrel protein n=1 Tax=Hyalangium versicolor TaxID=2861190 RepID=UPI001CC96977|nr:outer membrane beta-barrel protein [Hyalangium versicolor]
MKIRSVMGALAAATVLCAGPALAAVEATQVSRRLNLEDQETRVGLDVRLGLGALQGDIGRETGTGPLLGIAAGAQLNPLLGVEVGYEGQRLPIDDRLVGDGEALYRHNVGLLAKAGPLIERHWRPFVGAGLGLTYFNPSDGAEVLFNNDVAGEVPLAAGVDYNFGNIFAGARATYRLMFDEGFADDAFPNANGGNLLNASITLGGRF